LQLLADFIPDVAIVRMQLFQMFRRRVGVAIGELLAHIGGADPAARHAYGLN
jgi:hypothetical protein